MARNGQRPNPPPVLSFKERVDSTVASVGVGGKENDDEKRKDGEAATAPPMRVFNKNFLFTNFTVFSSFFAPATERVN